MRATFITCLLTLTLGLTACSNPYGPKQTGGAVLGAAGGALLGNQFGRGSGNAAATALGAVAGGYMGSEAGASLDRADYMYYNRYNSRNY
jgi:uncharacterized protein YcfJ